MESMGNASLGLRGTRALMRYVTPRKRARYAKKAATEARQWHRDLLGKARRETHPVKAR